MLTAIAIVVSTLVCSLTGQTLDSNECLSQWGEYNATSRMCQCKPGYEGSGDLCCTPVNAKDLCFLTGDPYLRSVQGQTVSINIPCTFCVNVMEGRTQSGRDCVWEVLGTTDIEERGSMYYARIKVGVSINKKSPKYISFSGDNILDPVTNTIFAQGSTVIEGETITLAHDAAAGIWSMEGCGHKLLFRPNKANIAGKPGLCMQAPKGSSTKSVSAGNACNLGPSFSKDIPWRYGLLEASLNIRLNFDSQQRASLPNYDATCSKIDLLMDQFCRGISGDAMVKCGPILYNSVIRSCLDSAGVKGEGIAGLFHMCLDSYCAGESTKCDALKNNVAVNSCFKSLTDCNTWPYYYQV